MVTKAQLRTASAAVVVGAGLTLAPFALAAPASAGVPSCQAGTAAYPPASCSQGGGSVGQGSTVPVNVSSVPNGSAISENALNGTSVTSINTGNPGASSGPDLGLVGGGAALVVIALGGGLFVLRRRHNA